MENQDLIRELQKVGDILTTAEVHFMSKDQMNAALHMSNQVRYTPLTSAVRDASATINNLISRLGDD